MKSKFFRTAISLVLCIICVACLFITPAFAAQGTDGDELHVVDPSNLEIQLGINWVGVEFMLRTDAGIYPGTITVGEDGVLRMEIGGSKTYILSWMQSGVAVPDPLLLQAPATQEDLPNQIAATEASDANSEAGIPIVHIVVFVGGVIIATGALIVMHITGKRREADESDDDDDYDE